VQVTDDPRFATRDCVALGTPHPPDLAQLDLKSRCNESKVRHERMPNCINVRPD
jgi:hypothetical protein